MVKKYIPKQKDIVYVNFDPTKGLRPAIIISNDIFNKFTNMVMVCPITTNTKEFPTHHLLKTTKKIKGSVLCEHIRSIDYEIRSLKYVEKCPNDEFENIIELLKSCIDE